MARDSRATEPPATDRPLVETPPVKNPKDARGIAACNLLTPAQLTELGLLSETARPVRGQALSGQAEACTWNMAGDTASAASVGIVVDLPIGGLEGLHLVREKFAEFEPGEVAGHPSIHADYTAGPVCTIYVAVTEHQLLTADGDLAGRPRADPCAPSRRMAELVLSNLPPLTEPEN